MTENLMGCTRQAMHVKNMGVKLCVATPLLQASERISLLANDTAYNFPIKTIQK